MAHGLIPSLRCSSMYLIAGWYGLPGATGSSTWWRCTPSRAWQLLPTPGHRRPCSSLRGRPGGSALLYDSSTRYVAPSWTALHLRVLDVHMATVNDDYCPGCPEPGLSCPQLCTGGHAFLCLASMAALHCCTTAAPGAWLPVGASVVTVYVCPRLS